MFTKIPHAERGTIHIKHIKRDLSSNAWVRPPGWIKGVGQRPKLMVRLHI